MARLFSTKLGSLLYSWLNRTRDFTFLKTKSKVSAMETPAIIMMTLTFACIITAVIYFFSKLLRKEREKERNKAQ